MRLFQTYWSKPGLKGNTNPYCFLVLIYVSAKSIKEQGYELVLYTDVPEWFEGFPYDDIIKIDMDDTNPRMFAAIKSRALEQEPLGSVHLDYDIILDKPCIRWDGTSDILVQCFEPKAFYSKERDFIKKNGTPSLINKYGLSDSPYCMGVIGFNDKTIKDVYLKNYNDAIEIYKSISIPNDITLDYLFEQAFLPAVTKNLEKSVQVVLKGINGKDVNAYHILPNNLRYMSTEIVGYHHYHGRSKWEPDIWQSIIKHLDENDIKLIYTNFCKAIK